MVDEASLEAQLLDGVAALEPGESLDPAAIARALGGAHPDGWGPVMQPLRRAAIRLAREGRLVLLRKGKPADPEDLRGLYRIGAPRQD